MSRSAKPKTHADQFRKLEYRQPKDVDPEDEFQADFNADSNESDSEAEEANNLRGREHYETVGSSNIRRAQDVDIVAAQYTGSRVNRKRAFNTADEEHDPFVQYNDEYSSDEEEEAAGGPKQNRTQLKRTQLRELGDSEEEDEIEDEFGDEEDSYDGTNGDEIIEDEESEDGSKEPSETWEDDEIDRDQLRRMIADDRANVVATIARATQIDAEKGRAVKKQKAAFDSLLNIRIKLQNGIISTNSMSGAEDDLGEDTEDLQIPFEAAEQAAIKLLNTLEDIRQTLRSSGATSQLKPFKVNSKTDSRLIWEHFKGVDGGDLSQRQKILQKWSNKTQVTVNLATSQKLNGSSTHSSVLDVVNNQLMDVERLVKRTRLPRSCAPLQISKGIAESDDIYDDADFYGLMLKELLEQRSIDASNVQTDTIAQHWQAVRQAKTRKKVDTKASKGRKIRYIIHEKLQNFMAPENRGTWGDRQIDELFGSLLGKRIVLNEAEQDHDDGTNGAVSEQEALVLFRS